ncbi:MAG: hypothetical protein IPP29_08210 [Bacteroidetes bacterium]|nr:hypothetical protein [Bacteroidota bacterium]
MKNLKNYLINLIALMCVMNLTIGTSIAQTNYFAATGAGTVNRKLLYRGGLQLLTLLKFRHFKFSFWS